MKLIKLVLFTYIIIMGYTQAAYAHNAFITLNPYGAYLKGNAVLKSGWGPNAGIFLPNSNNISSFALGFVIPPDFDPSWVIRVKIIWHTNETTEPISCGIALKPNFISVSRKGRKHIAGAGASTGLQPLGDNSLVAINPNESNTKVYEIISPDPSDSALQAFDSIIFGLFRSPNDNLDTCPGNLIIQGIYITYGPKIT